MESSSGPDMKQKALPSFKLTCSAWPKAPNWPAALSSASKLSKNCCSVSSSLGKLPLVLSWVSMKYFTVVLPWLGGGSKVMYMHDIWQMFMGFRISRACQSSYWGFLVGVWDM